MVFLQVCSWYMLLQLHSKVDSHMNLEKQLTTFLQSAISELMKCGRKSLRPLTWDERKPNSWFTNDPGLRKHSAQLALVVKIPPANAGDLRDAGLTRRSGRSRGEGNRNPLQCKNLEIPMVRGAWRATVHRVAQSRTRLKQLSIA